MIPANANTVDIIFLEEINSYSYIDGRVYRWDMERQFTLLEFERISETSINETSKVELKLLDDTHRGEPEIIVEPSKIMNFDMEFFIHDDRKIEEIRWKTFLTRDVNNPEINAGEPFSAQELQHFIVSGNKRFDVKSSPDFFSANLQYSEFHNDSNDIEVKRKVNTELSANNDENGIIIRSAMHIIKRDNESNVIFEYDSSIQRIDGLTKFVNFFDKPYLWIPYQIGFAILALNAYIQGQKYWTKHGLKIIKTNVEKPELKSDAAEDLKNNDTK